MFVTGFRFVMPALAAAGFATAAMGQDLPSFTQAELDAAPACEGDWGDREGTLLCTCAAGQSPRSVWGSGPYTGDSNLCSAAVHAGVIAIEGGAILAVAKPGQEKYEGSSANGVNSRDWESFDVSFDVMTPPMKSAFALCGAAPGNGEMTECSCEAGDVSGSVWGSGPYTGDSNVCAAARHAGVIGEEGGDVSVIGLPGLEGYVASEANGVKTGDWPSYDASFIFNRN